MSVHSFQEGLKKSKLKGCICESCDNLMLPPRMICTKCGSADLKEYSFDGNGVILTKTVIHVPLTKFQRLSPYTVGIIKLDEGALVAGMILGDIEKIKIEDRVRAVYLDEGEGKLLAFISIN